MFKKVFLGFLLISAALFAKEAATIDFNLKTIDGKTLTVHGTKNGLDFSDFKNKIVLLEFWGTHCPPCLFSIPHYIELTKEYKDKVAMVAVEVQMTPKDQLINFVKAKGINYNVLSQKENMDFVRYVATRAQWRGAIPYLLIFGPNGEVATIQRGMVSKEYVEGVIKQLLAPKTTIKTEANKTK
jgi:thiol-disulfide isomerase/thioredoxin